MSRFDKLIGLIEPLNSDTYGEIIIDREHKGTLDDPIHFPFPVYTETINKLIDAVYEVEREYPEYGLNRYGEILNKHGIEWGDRSMKDADVTEMDIQGVLALLMGMVRSERFCDGSILDFMESGVVFKWLERIKEIETESEERL